MFRKSLCITNEKEIGLLKNTWCLCLGICHSVLGRWSMSFNTPAHEQQPQAPRAAPSLVLNLLWQLCPDSRRIGFMPTVSEYEDDLSGGNSLKRKKTNFLYVLISGPRVLTIYFSIYRSCTYSTRNIL